MDSKPEKVDFFGGELVITNLRIPDAIAIAHIQKHDEAARADAVRNSVQLGARVLEYASDRLNGAEIAERIEASTDTATKILRHATDTAKDALEHQIGGTFGENGRMQALLRSQLAALSRDLEKHLDPQVASSVLGRFNAEIRAGWAENTSSIMRLLNIDEPGSVTHRLATQLDAHHRSVSEQLTAIMHEMAARSGLRAERLRGTIKGVAFEDHLEHVLGAWAIARHDRVTRCGQTTGSSHNSKAGDFVIEISPRDAGGPGLKLVIEARDREVGTTQARRDLDRAIDNRDGAVGIYVTTDRGSIPKGAPPVHFMDPDRVFVHVDWDEDEGFDPTLLEVALEVARARAVASRSIDQPQFDAATISAKVAAAINATSRFTEIKKQLSGIGSGVERVKALVDDVRGDVRSALTALQDEVDRQIGSTERAA